MREPLIRKVGLLVSLLLVAFGAWGCPKIVIPQPPTPPPTTTTTTTTLPPEQPPTPPEPPTPPPPQLPAGCIVPAEAQLVLHSPQRPSKLNVAMDVAHAAVGDLRGHYDFPASRRLIAEQLWKQGLCAFAGQEAVFVLAPDGLWEEWHVVAETDGGWPVNAYKYVHHVEGEVTEPPPVQPPPATGVDLSPLPDPNAAEVVGKKCGANCWDFTVRECGTHAAAYGFPGRRCYPLGPDLTAVRFGRERYITGDTSGSVAGPEVPNPGVRCEADAGQAWPTPENWSQCKAPGATRVRMCRVSDGRCSVWVAR